MIKRAEVGIYLDNVANNEHADRYGKDVTVPEIIEHKINEKIIALNIKEDSIVSINETKENSYISVVIFYKK